MDHRKVWETERRERERGRENFEPCELSPFKCDIISFEEHSYMDWISLTYLRHTKIKGKNGWEKGGKKRKRNETVRKRKDEKVRKNNFPKANAHLFNFRSFFLAPIFWILCSVSSWRIDFFFLFTARLFFGDSCCKSLFCWGISLAGEMVGKVFLFC